MHAILQVMLQPVIWVTAQFPPKTRFDDRIWQDMVMCGANRSDVVKLANSYTNSHLFAI
jgi:hypothetical protein